MNQPSAPPAGPARGGPKVAICFGTFAVFFLFYVGSALIQSPAGKSLAVIPVAGMPLGLLLSLAVFPLSWLLIAFWFWKAR